MDFISLTFGCFLLIGLLVYYCIPKKKQWIWLLLLGMFFYAYASIKLCFFITMTILTSYLYGIFMDHLRKKYTGDVTESEAAVQDKLRLYGKAGLFIVIAGNAFVLFFLKLAASNTPIASRLSIDRFAILLPMGISFYTLQIIAYCVDVYRGKIEPQRNLCKYALFVSFFPQILQGPIPRYEQLMPQLLEGHTFDYKQVTFGLQLMLWGFFQKLVIADRANIIVNKLFGEYQSFKGFYVLIAGILYSIQLYTDFAGCVCIARGAAQAFGISLQDNFNHPYFADSIQDFWHRWHISLSSWLRDYIYIPLGGNRKGIVRKYVNILLTFLVSGIWHGVGTHFILWGLLHGLYQIAGSMMKPVRDWFMRILHVDRNRFSHRLLKQISTFFMVMFAWILFRVESVSMFFVMMKNMLNFNPWIFVNGDLELLGVSGMEFRLLLVSIGILWAVSMLQEYLAKKQSSIRKELACQALLFRWIIIFTALFAVIIFGVYGPGYDSTQFIYGGF